MTRNEKLWLVAFLTNNWWDKDKYPDKALSRLIRKKMVIPIRVGKIPETHTRYELTDIGVKAGIKSLNINKPLRSLSPRQRRDLKFKKLRSRYDRYDYHSWVYE